MRLIPEQPLAEELPQFSGLFVQQSWLRGSCGGLQDFCEQFRAWPPCRGAPRKDSVLRGLLRHRPKQLQSAAYFAAVSSQSERFYCVKSVGLFASRASQRIWCSPYSQGVEKGDKLSPDRRVSTEQNNCRRIMPSFGDRSPADRARARFPNFGIWAKQVQLLAAPSLMPRRRPYRSLSPSWSVDSIAH